MNREITSEGTTAWTITVRFTYRAEGWNYFPRPDQTTLNVIHFELLYSDEAGTNPVYPYASSNFGAAIL